MAILVIDLIIQIYFNSYISLTDWQRTMCRRSRHREVTEYGWQIVWIWKFIIHLHYQIFNYFWNYYCSQRNFLCYYYSLNSCLGIDYWQYFSEVWLYQSQKSRRSICEQLSQMWMWLCFHRTYFFSLVAFWSRHSVTKDFTISIFVNMLVFFL